MDLKGLIVMGVTSRQRMILHALLDKEQGVTVKEMADEIEVSTRTIHRELHDLEPLLDQYDLKLVKRAGIGICLVGEPLKKEEFKLSLYNQTTVEYSPDERKVLILCQLLESTEPVKLASLAYDCKVTTATISNDLDELEDWIQKYDLILVRRRGYGVELGGLEASKRKAMSTLISEHLDEFELLGILKENIHGKSLKNINTVSDRLLGLVQKEKLILIENALHKMENELPYPLADSSFVGLVIHLALAIERIEKGEKIHFDQAFLKELEGTPEFEASEKMIQRLRSTFQMDIPEAEIGYITMHLRGAKVRRSYDERFDIQNIELASKVNQLIHYCEDKLKVNFRKDHSLLQGLITHMEPSIFRIQKNMKIRNPLLDEIKGRYKSLFEVVSEAVKAVFPNLFMPEEEIGYLVMHFGSSLERLTQTNDKYRALIVCSSGIGSSKILASRIQRELPYIGPVQISLFEIEKVPPNDYDLIISTVPLPMAENDYILVSPLLTKEDIQRINLFLRNLEHREEMRNEVVILPDRPFMVNLKKWQSYIDHAIEIIESFRCDNVKNHDFGVEETLVQICSRLEQSHVIKNKQAVTKKLLEREKLGGLGIAKTKSALFHSRNEEVTRVSFSLYYLEQPLVIKSMEERLIDVNKIFLLLGPKDISKQGLEILSEVSALLIEDEIIKVLATKDPNQISTYFLNHLYQFIMDKIQKER
jgi:mannitol operon transcriptional antiterminator